MGVCMCAVRFLFNLVRIWALDLYLVRHILNKLSHSPMQINHWTIVNVCALSKMATKAQRNGGEIRMKTPTNIRNYTNFFVIVQMLLTTLKATILFFYIFSLLFFNVLFLIK